MEAVIEYETALDESREDVRPRCPGCNSPIFWIDELHPYCRCGAPLFFPIPTSEHI
jgi:hypothetical protein